jgi:hypothetical protein
VKERRCTDCGKTKPETEFSWLWKKKNLRRSYCNPCNVKRVTIWVKNNKVRAYANRMKSYYKTYYKDKYKRNNHV